jgi:hypothetical protein
MGVIRAEWLKLRSVRSNLVLLGTSVLLGAGLGALFTAVVPEHNRRGGRSPLYRPFDRFEIALAGLFFAKLLLGVFGVHLVGQEYRFSTIRATFSAVPRRLRVMGSKLTVLILTAAVVSAVTIGLAYVIGGAILSSRGFPIDTSVEGFSRVLIGEFLLALVYAMAGYGVGMIVRQPIGGIIIVLAFPLVIEQLFVGLLKTSVGKWMPYNAGAQLLEQHPDKDVFGAWPGFFYFLAFAAVLCVIGAALANRRDA